MATLALLDLQRAEGWMEFACLAESALAAEEHAAWGRAATEDDWDRTDETEKNKIFCGRVDIRNLA